MTFVRTIDWEQRLAAYLEPLRTRAFGWGDLDCCTFAAGGVEAMTGIDPMPEFRGRYATAIGAARALRRHGAGQSMPGRASLPQMLAATLDGKFEQVGAHLAKRGDLVMTDGLLGIVWTNFAFAVGCEVGADDEREGLLRLERAMWVTPIAWRVPFAD